MILRENSENELTVFILFIYWGILSARKTIYDNISNYFEI